MDAAAERVALDAAVRAGVVSAALAQQALAHQATLAQAGTPCSALALVAERLDPAGRAALQALVARGRETVGESGAPTAGAPRPGALPAPGERVGPYVVERELGRGGMGAVFVATHVELDRPVALKLLLSVADARLAERFAREAQAIARLTHPAIVGLHEVGVDALGRRFIAMQLVEGEALKARLDRAGPLEPRAAARLTLELARGLEYAHGQGLLHRDLKPHNVLLDADGRARLTDFGLARDAHDARLTTTGELLGTPAYMAPEQAAGERDRLDARTDVYGLGATLYHALTGQPPFDAPSLVNVITSVLTRPPVPPRQVRAEVPPALEAICLRCLEKEPAARYPSCAALAEDLERFLGGARVAAPGRPRAARRLALVLAAGAGATAVTVALALALAPRPPAPAAPAEVAGGGVAVASSAAGVADVLEAPPPAVGGPAEHRVDARTWRHREELQLRDAWMVQPTAEGLRLSARRGQRVGLFRHLRLTREAPFELVVEVDVEQLEVGVPLVLVWKKGANIVASTGLVARWRRRGGARVAEHLLTLLGKPPALAGVRPALVAPKVGRDVEVTVLGPGPQRVELHLRYEPAPSPLLRAWTEGDLLPPVLLGLPTRLPTGECDVGVLLQRIDVHDPWTGDNPHERSSVVVRRFDVEAEPGVLEPARDDGPHTVYGLLGRRFAAAGQGPALAGLAAELDDHGLLSDLRGFAPSALFLRAVACAADPALRPRVDGYLDQVHALAQASEGKQEPDLWRAFRGDLAGLSPAARAALFTWLQRRRGDLQDPLAVGLGIVRPGAQDDIAEDAAEDDAEGGDAERVAVERAGAPDWALAVLCLEQAGAAETHPLELGQALTMIGDLDAAHALLERAMREAPDEARRRQAVRSAAWTAYRQRRFEDAERLWTEVPPPAGRYRDAIRRGLHHHLSR